MTDGKSIPAEKADISLSDFLKRAPVGTTIVGLDLGDKTIGVAVSDTMHITATALKTIRRASFEKDMGELENLLRGRTLGGFVSGLPKQMNGEEGEIAKEVRHFAEKLSKEIDLPIFFWDERLSSSAMENFLIKEVDMSRGKRKKVLDSSAAAYILQGVLDALRFA